jgi:hypothetical protein
LVVVARHLFGQQFDQEGANGEIGGTSPVSSRRVRSCNSAGLTDSRGCAPASARFGARLRPALTARNFELADSRLFQDLAVAAITLRFSD